MGAITEADEDTVVAEIVTQDGSLVQKFAIDRRSGVMRQLYFLGVDRIHRIDRTRQWVRSILIRSSQARN